MSDTPEKIKQIQLKIWLSKPPMERLRQFLIDNDAFYRLTEGMKQNTREKINQYNQKLNDESN
ncbi:hypothetical protein BH09BAC2_BH09BAC2_20180 [soil metagenome]